MMTRYNKEKLYELVPAIYRQHDANLDKPLEALLGVIAEQVEILEDDIAKLYENWFIETCEEWLVPYIGDLVGAKLLHTVVSSQTTTGNAINTSITPRAWVANTIRYRRRKGTASVLEQIARDVTGWNARVVEFFTLLGTTQNINHLRLENIQTPDLRDTEKLELLDTPFDSIPHTVNVRNIRSKRGYHNIPNIGIFLWRIQAYPVYDAPAFSHGDNRYSFSQIGYDIQLFNNPVAETSITHFAEEINLPTTIRRNTLKNNLHDYYGKEKSILVKVKDADSGFLVPIDSDKVLICNLQDWKHRPPTGMIAIDPILGRIAFPIDEEDQSKNVHVNYYYGFSADIGGGFYNIHNSGFNVDVDLLFLVDLEEDALRQFITNNLKFLKISDAALSDIDTNNIKLSKDKKVAQLQVNDISYEFGMKRNYRENNNTIIYRIYRISKKILLVNNSNNNVFTNIFDAITQWNKEDKPSAIFEILDSETYKESLEFVDFNTLEKDSTIVIKASENQRPVLLSADQDDDVYIQSLKISGKSGSNLILEGLVIDQQLEIIPDKLDTLQINHCTLVPKKNDDASIIMSTENSDNERNDNLTISLYRSISGKIIIMGSEAKLVSLDSIIDRKGKHGSSHAIKCYKTSIENSTIFGKVDVTILDLASNSIFTDIVTVRRLQEGCVRFSYIPDGSKTPRCYRCQPANQNSNHYPSSSINNMDTLRIKPIFTSEQYGDPGYAQLHKDTTPEIFEGADNKAEMGAFNILFQPQRIKNLESSLDEYLRFGLEAGILLVDISKKNKKQRGGTL